MGIYELILLNDWNDTNPLPRDVLDAALQRVLASAEFRQSERLKRFLAFCYERTLAGEAGALKESIIGHAVFDRPPGYDTQAEPIVRVEARRLRQKLDAYYKNAGPTESVRIRMPIGSYGLAFRRTGPLLTPPDEPVEAELVAPPPPAAPVRSRRTTAAWFSVALTAALAGAYWWSADRAPAGALVRVTSDRGLTQHPNVTPDGRWLAYSSDRDTNAQLAIYLQDHRGSAKRLTFDQWDAVEPAVEPGGQWVVYRSMRPGGGLYLVQATGGEPRLVASDGFRPRVSPDGHSIIFSTTEPKNSWGRLWITEAAGGEPRQLLPEFADIRSPLWADSGREILFYGTWISGTPDRERDFWSVPFPSGAPRKLGVVPGGHPAILALRSATLNTWLDNAVYFFTRAESHDTLWRQRFAYHRAAGPPEQLITSTNFADHPSASAGRVYFSSGSWDGQIVALPADTDTGQVTGAAEAIVSSPAHDRSVHVDPAGRTLAYLADHYSGRTVHWRDLATGRDQQLTLASVKVGLDYPTLSPDGRRLAVRALERPQRPIWIADLVTGKQTQVCADCGGPTSWSPDGHRLLYEPGAATAYVGLLDLDTGRSHSTLQHPEYSLRGARFSPGGQWIAFHAELSGNRRQIFLAQPGAPSAAWIPVTNGQGLDFNPAWSPNGRLLYFLSDRDGFVCLWAQRLDPVTGALAGPPFAIHHRHVAREAIPHRPEISYKMLGPVAGPHHIYFSVEQSRANIWALSLNR